MLGGEDGLEEEVGVLAHELGRAQFLTGSLDAAAERIELALSIAEAFGLPDLLANALQTKAFLLSAKGRPAEALILTKHALELSNEHDLSATGLRAYNNLAESLADQDRFTEALEIIERGLERARRLGDRRYEWALTRSQIPDLIMLGRWDEALTRAAEFESDAGLRGAEERVEVEVYRGRMAEAQAILEQSSQEIETAIEWRVYYDHAQIACITRAGLSRGGACHRQSNVDARREFGMMSVVKLGVVEAITAALDCGDLAAADELLGIIEGLRPGELGPFLRAQGQRLRARLDAQRGQDEAVDERFRAAAAEFRELGTPFWLAVTLLEHAEWLVRNGRGDEASALIPEGRTIFDQLGAVPWLARLEALAAGNTAYAAAGGET